MKKIKLLMMLSVAAGLTACGGGGSDEAALSPAPVATENPTPAATQEPTKGEPVKETSTPVATTQDPVKEEPVAEEPVKEEPVAEEPVKEDPAPVVEEPKVEKQTGYYIDSAVSGVSYTCGTFTGITGTDGSFSYEKNQDCTFKVGNMVLREVKATTLTVNGLTIVEHNPIAAQLLQTLDSDGDASNGITLLENIASILAENGFDKVLPTGNVDDKLKKIAQQLKEKDGKYDGSFKSVKETKLHLQQTITTLREDGVKTTESLDVVSTSVESIVVEEPKPEPVKTNTISIGLYHDLNADGVMNDGSSIDPFRYYIVLSTGKVIENNGSELTSMVLPTGSEIEKIVIEGLGYCIYRTAGDDTDFHFTLNTDKVFIIPFIKAGEKDELNESKGNPPPLISAVFECRGYGYEHRYIFAIGAAHLLESNGTLTGIEGLHVHNYGETVPWDTSDIN